MIFSLTKIFSVFILITIFEVILELTWSFDHSIIENNLMKYVIFNMRLIIFFITKNSIQNIINCNTSMEFISIKNLMNIFVIDREWFFRILMIIVVIKLSRFSKCSLISSRILENSSWMNFISIMFVMIEISRNEDVNEIWEMIEMIVWWIIKEIERWSLERSVQVVILTIAIAWEWENLFWITFSIMRNRFLIEWVTDFESMKKIKFKKILSNIWAQKHEKFDKTMNLTNDDIDENHVILIKEMMIEMMTFWLHLVSNTLHHCYDFSCFKKSWIERFYDIENKILIILFKKIELNLIFRWYMI